MFGKIFIRIAFWFCILLIFAGVYFVYLAIHFPVYYPDHTLALGEKMTSFFRRITLPIKLTRLSWKPADTEVLMPVYGMKVGQVADTWHAPRDEDRVHEGQDMFATRGTPIFSATFGYIVRMNTDGLGGNSIYIASAGGRRYYYAHMDRFPLGLRVGQEVTTDTVIGFVGNTGNAERTPPHLHLGVYLLRQAIDPLPLLTNRPPAPLTKNK